MQYYLAATDYDKYEWYWSVKGCKCFTSLLTNIVDLIKD